MKPKSALAMAAATLASVIAYLATMSGQAEENSAPVYVTQIPAGYRDWKVISVAHEEGNLHSFAIVLGNDVAIKAYREGKLPFPDGAIIACTTVMSRRRRTTRSLATNNPSFPAPPRAYSSRSRTRKSTRRRAVGGSGTSTQMANLPTQRCLKPAFPVTSLPKLPT